jgi:hypothetical protein
MVKIIKKPKHRSSVTGRMVSKDYADANPDTTVSESKPILTLESAAEVINNIRKHYPMIIDGMDIDGVDIEITRAEMAGDGKRILLLTSE